MSSVNNKGTQYDPPKASSDDADLPKTDSGSGHDPQSSQSHQNVVGDDTAEATDTADVTGISSDEEPPILPPRVSITPRSGLKTRNTNRRRKSHERHSGAIDEQTLNGERASGRTGTISRDTNKPLETSCKLSPRPGNPLPNSGKISKVIGKHTRKDEAPPVAWTAEYRSKLSKEDRLMRLQITSHNSHPECLKPASAAGLTRRLTLGNYLPNLSSAQFVVKNEVNFWPSARRQTEGVGRSEERVTYSRHAVRGTGIHSARLRTDEGRRRSNSTPRLPPARKGTIMAHRVSLVSRSADQSFRAVPNYTRPASELAHETSPVPSAKQARLQRYHISKEDLSKPIERVATANNPPPPASDASDPTPSEYEQATGKVHAWITHRERLNGSQTSPETMPSMQRVSWNAGISPLRRDMMLPLRNAHPFVRSTLTVGNFMSDGMASKGVSARAVALRMGSGRGQISIPS
ncbi:uncharacterized protein LOC110980729 [Acanthaster planci]|uniref:Uncharacterized protein LOC110980729 n=1 Tax=Acanthaster planci TaxID=133434 RepID=A0A8B7YPK4_ACAPL|nr:uncharacterized protein LOC110980729 [Acanthaster planci]